MNTYRVYILDTTAPLAPVTHVAFIRGEKYANAWQNARGALNGKRDDKLFSDEACAKRATFAKDCVVAKIDDIKPRNVKLDKSALAAIIADDNVSADDKLAAMRAMLA